MFHHYLLSFISLLIITFQDVDKEKLDELEAVKERLEKLGQLRQTETNFSKFALSIKKNHDMIVIILIVNYCKNCYH